jgi:RNA polymerase sigma-70 factor (ECF subfamily)
MVDAREAADPGDDDARDVAAALSGDQEAFDLLVHRYQRRAVAVAYRLLGSIHDATDVAQDAFLRAYRKLADLEDPRRFGPWLLRIVTNLALNFRRSRGRDPTVSTEDLIEGPEPLRTASGANMASEAADEDSLETREMKDKVARAIDELPEKQRLALVLFSLEGLPQKDVAEIMGCSIELVKWNVFQARKTLRQRLADFLE